MNCEINQTNESVSLDNLWELKNIIYTFDEKIKWEISEKFKNLLDKWVNIESKKKYDDIKFFMELFDFPKLPEYNKIIFDTLTAVYQFGYNFSMRLEWNKYIIYPSSQYKNAWMLNPSQLWYIESGIFYSEVSIFNRDNIADNNQLNLDLDKICDNNYVLLKSQNEELKKINKQLSQKRDILTQKNQKLIAEVKELKNNVEWWDLWNNQIDTNQNTSQKSPEKVSHVQEYTIQPWDTLWQIVKTHYNLTSNRDIANCVNKLVKYNIENNTDNRNIAEDNTPDWIFWDKIYAWQKILLAWELKFRDQVFSLKKEK